MSLDSRAGEGLEVDQGGLERRRPLHRGTSGSNPLCSSGESSTNLRALRKKEPRGSGAEEFFAARETNGSKGATRYLISVSAPSASARYGTTAALVSHAAALPAAVQQQPKRGPHPCLSTGQFVCSLAIAATPLSDRSSPERLSIPLHPIASRLLPVPALRVSLSFSSYGLRSRVQASRGNALLDSGPKTSRIGPKLWPWSTACWLMVVRLGRGPSMSIPRTLARFLSWSPALVTRHRHKTLDRRQTLLQPRQVLRRQPPPAAFDHARTALDDAKAHHVDRTSIAPLAD